MEHTTKDRILDAAEKLFAANGFTDTSLRAITAEAGANLAAVNYYFQSKDALILAVFERRLGPLTAARLAMLDTVEARAGDGPLPVEHVLKAFLEPVFQTSHAQLMHFGRLLGRMYTDPGNLFERVFREQFAATKERFAAALHRAVPGLAPEEMFWRMHFCIGAMAHTVAGLKHLTVTSGGVCDTSDPRAIVDRLIAFLAAGFRAPAPSQQGDQQCTHTK